MKRHTLKISTLSILSVLCAGVTTNVMAAGTVRSLGGAGTYNGTAAASTATRTTTPTRAGSLRISPSSARMIGSETSASNSASTGSANTRAAGSAQRLSIGKYLGSSVTTATATAASNKASSQAAESAISGIEDVLDKMRDGDAKGIIAIDTDGTISIDLETLKNELTKEGLASGELAFDYNPSTQVLSWTDSENNAGSINIASLEGAYTSIAALESAVETLATKEELSAGLATKVDNSTFNALKERVDSLDVTAGGIAEKQPKSTGDYQIGMTGGTWATLSDAQQNALNSGVTAATVAQVETNKMAIANNAENVATSLTNLNTALGTKASQEDFNTLKNRVDGLTDVSGETSVSGQIQTALLNYTTTSDMNELLATKADSADLATVATTGSYNDLSNTPTKLSQFTNDVPYATKSELDAVSAIVSALTGDETATPISTQIDTAVGGLRNDVNDALAEVETALDGKQPVIEDLETIRSGAAAGATAVQPSDLATVATTGSYNDLNDKPTIPEIPAYTGTDYEVVWGYVNGVGQYIKVVNAAGE